MTHEQFITELETINQALADCQAELKRFYADLYHEDKVNTNAAQTLANAAKILNLSAQKIANNPTQY